MTTAIMGVGTIGTIVARNLVQGGEHVVLANRDKSKADKLAAELGDLASSAEVGDAIAQSDVIVLALWLDVMKFFIPEFGGKLVGKIVVDPSNPVGPDGKGGIKRILPADQSSGEIVASLLPRGARRRHQEDSPRRPIVRRDRREPVASGRAVCEGVRDTVRGIIHQCCTADPGAGRAVLRYRRCRRG